MSYDRNVVNMIVIYISLLCLLSAVAKQYRLYWRLLDDAWWRWMLSFQRHMWSFDKMCLFGELDTLSLLIITDLSFIHKSQLRLHYSLSRRVFYWLLPTMNMCRDHNGRRGYFTGCFPLWTCAATTMAGEAISLRCRLSCLIQLILFSGFTKNYDTVSVLLYYHSTMADMCREHNGRRGYLSMSEVQSKQSHCKSIIHTITWWICAVRATAG